MCKQNGEDQQPGEEEAFKEMLEGWGWGTLFPTANQLPASTATTLPTTKEFQNICFTVAKVSLVNSLK